MKLCILTFSHDPYDDRIYHREARSLAKRGHSVLILSLNQGTTRHSEYENITVKDIEAHHRDISALWFLKLYLLFREALKVQVDLYHCHEPESFIVGLALKILTGKKLVYDVHEYYPDLIKVSGRFYKYFYMLITHIIDPLFCRMADYVICADDEIRKLYSKFNRNVATLFNYPLIEYWEHNPPFQTHRGNHTLIYPGLIAENNGIWEMLAVAAELAKKYPNVRLLLIGGISADLRARIADYVQSMNLKDCIKCIGHIPHPEVAAHLKSATVGLLLYRPIEKYFKNIPNKQFEYALSELPFVASNLPPIKKFIDDAKAGILIQPGNIDEAVNAVDYLFTHPDEARKMGKTAKAAVHEKYNWALMEPKLIQIYEQSL